MENAKEMNVLLKAIQEAGVQVAKLFRSHLNITEKENKDPLTDADIQSNEILKKSLLGNFPDYGWLSEETVDDKERLKRKRVWIVDPIDGTKEFIQGIPEYAISVALVEKGTPLLGAVLNPMTNELYYAIEGKGAWRNRLTLHCDYPYYGKLRVLASRTEMEEGAWKKFENEVEIEARGSIAYKLALIAAGTAHSTFSLGPKSEWDIAAGALIVKEAGGMVTDTSKKPFVFNQSNVRVNGIIASTKKTYPLVHDLIRKSK